MQLLADGNLASQFVGEVFEEDHCLREFLLRGDRDTHHLATVDFNEF